MRQKLQLPDPLAEFEVVRTKRTAPTRTAKSSAVARTMLTRMKTVIIGENLTSGPPAIMALAVGGACRCFGRLWWLFVQPSSDRTRPHLRWVARGHFTDAKKTERFPSDQLGGCCRRGAVVAGAIRLPSRRGHPSSRWVDSRVEIVVVSSPVGLVLAVQFEAASRRGCETVGCWPAVAIGSAIRLLRGSPRCGSNWPDGLFRVSCSKRRFCRRACGSIVVVTTVTEWPGDTLSGDDAGRHRRVGTGPPTWLSTSSC